VVRGLASYLAASDSRHQVPPAGLLPRRCDRVTPYLYSPQEIAALVRAARSMAHPLRAVVFEHFVALMAVTGMRTGEATSTMLFDNVRVPAQRRLGSEGQGLPIALAGLDSGRLGIAAVATGVAQAALDVAVKYAKERESFGKPVIEHQGLAFLLADMAAAVESARATYLFAARLRDAGRPFSRQASIAKMTATDNAMKVTTDAVQVLGGAGYTRDFPVERYMRETKVMQIFEGTNQIQRMVISRHLARS